MPVAQVFSCEFCEIFKNTLFTEHLWTTASVDSLLFWKHTTLRKDFAIKIPCFVNSSINYNKKVGWSALNHFLFHWNTENTSRQKGSRRTSLMKKEWRFHNCNTHIKVPNNKPLTCIFTFWNIILFFPKLQFAWLFGSMLAKQCPTKFKVA